MKNYPSFSYPKTMFNGKMTPDTGLNLGLNPENNVLPGSAEKLNSFTTNFTNLTQVFEPTENTNDPVEINEKGAELTPLQPACQPLTVATNPMSESNEIGFSNNHSLPSNNFPNNGYDRAGSSLQWNSWKWKNMFCDVI